MIQVKGSSASFFQCRYSPGIPSDNSGNVDFRKIQKNNTSHKLLLQNVKNKSYLSPHGLRTYLHLRELVRFRCEVFSEQ